MGRARSGEVNATLGLFLIHEWIKIVFWVAFGSLRAGSGAGNATFGLFLIHEWIRIVFWVAFGPCWGRFGAANATFGLFLIHEWIRIVVWVALGAAPTPKNAGAIGLGAEWRAADHNVDRRVLSRWGGVPFWVRW
jgi:hypothetical protein